MRTVFAVTTPSALVIALCATTLWACASGAEGDGPSGSKPGVEDDDSSFDNPNPMPSGGSFDNPMANGGSRIQPGVFCTEDCRDFPAEPVFDPNGPSMPPSDAPEIFGEADNFTEPGPCVFEPQLSSDSQPGALLPYNWLRPRFRFEPAAGEDLWEIRLSAERERHDLVVYTTATSWHMPRAGWEQIAMNLRDTPITVTVRGIDSRNPGQPSGTRGQFQIAPVEAGGKMVYWATTSSQVQPSTSKLVGFAVGDEGVIDALTIPEVSDRGILSEGGRNERSGQGVDDGHVQCIGCHVSTPDGDAVGFVDHWPWNAVLASIEEGSVGQQPSYVSSGAATLLNQPWLGMLTFSPAHWGADERIAVLAYSSRSSPGGVGFTDSWTLPRTDDRLAWIDLQANASFDADPTQGDVQQQLNDQIANQLGASFGMLAMQGETRSVAAPDWSHDGTRIVYTSATHTQDGRLADNNQEVDLHEVPYNDGQGGQVMPVAGASEPGVAEYYPALSADDELIAFNRVATLDSAPIYYRPDAEIHVVPSGGGEPLRLSANDPPACSGERSPGVINSWAKWSPRVDRVSESQSHPPRSFYWLIFSSARAYPGQFEIAKTQYSPPDTRSSQLYMTAVVRNDDTGELTSYGAVYLWNQDPATSNLTPAWDDFKIPQVPPPD